jgi:hypothetical protein
MARRIPDASPRKTDKERGYAAEDATREAAAIWGLPATTPRSISMLTHHGHHQSSRIIAINRASPFRELACAKEAAGI